MAARQPLTIGPLLVEEKCPTCNGSADDGKSRLLNFITGPWCDTCHGLGVVPNKVGLALIEFITDHVTSKEGGLLPIKK